MTPPGPPGYSSRGCLEVVQFVVCLPSILCIHSRGDAVQPTEIQVVHTASTVQYCTR